MFTGTMTDPEPERGTMSDPEPEELDEDKDWIQKAIKRPGALHRELGVPKDKDIPKGKINKAISKLKKKDKDDEEKGTQLSKGDERELKFNLNKFEKFKDKIIYLVSSQLPSEIEPINAEDSNHEIARKSLWNAIFRENYQSRISKSTRTPNYSLEKTPLKKSPCNIAVLRVYSFP